MHGHKGFSKQHQSARPLDNRESRPGLVSLLTAIESLTHVTVPAVAASGVVILTNKMGVT